MQILRLAQAGRLRWLGRAAGFAVLAFIAFATLSPIGLRPQIAGQGLEHVMAYLVLAGLFGFGFPRHLPSVLVGVAIFAIGAELLQGLSAGRHARFADAAMKIGGAGLGILVAALASRMMIRLTTKTAAR